MTRNKQHVHVQTQEGQHIDQTLDEFTIMLLEYEQNKYPQECMDHLKQCLIQDITRKLMLRKHTLSL